ncbi:MAG: family 43 glycosylhydrolase [Rikenellaceae bacterium]
MRNAINILATLLLSITYNNVSAGNPILKKGASDFLYIADPAAEVFNGKVYVYCSHDQPDATGYSSMQDYVVLESKNLKRWKNHGVVLKPREYSWAHGQMNAPDAAYKDGWYYYYFPYNKQYIGVAKSRNPEGPWKEAVNNQITKIFDPTVFVDDDGQAYIFGNNTGPEPENGGDGRYIKGAKLKDNMIELDGEWQRLSEEVVNEAVHIFKREGKYYFTARKGNRTAYFMSETPMPTKEVGYAKFMGYITPPQSDAPAHNSFIEFKKQWYIFYQRGDVNDGTFHRRSVCFDKIYFNEDGTIQPVEYTLDDGVKIDK